MDQGINILVKTPDQDFKSLNSSDSGSSSSSESVYFGRDSSNQNIENKIDPNSHLPKLSGQNEEVKSYSGLKNLNEGIKRDDEYKMNHAPVNLAGNANNYQHIPGYPRSPSKPSSYSSSSEDITFQLRTPDKVDTKNLYSPIPPPPPLPKDKSLINPNKFIRDNTVVPSLNDNHQNIIRKPEPNVESRIESAIPQINQPIGSQAATQVQSANVSNNSRYKNEFISNFTEFGYQKSCLDKLCCKKETNLYRLRKLKQERSGNDRDRKELKSFIQGNLVEDLSIVDLYLICSLVEENNLNRGSIDYISKLVKRTTDESIKALKTEDFGINGYFEIILSFLMQNINSRASFENVSITGLINQLSGLR